MEVAKKEVERSKANQEFTFTSPTEAFTPNPTQEVHPENIDKQLSKLHIRRELIIKRLFILIMAFLFGLLMTL